MLNTKYDYKKLKRKNVNGKRHYLTEGLDDGPVPSVTTILDKTKSEADRAGLEAWKRAVGHQKAQEICNEAAGRGTRMHKYLEDYIINDELSIPGTNPYAKQANKMAGIIIEHGMSQCDEIWGTEVPLYFPEIYAGTCDCVGIFNGKETLIDFKQTNKPKTEERVQDYYKQLCAYAEAHNELHGTNINQGVILMCSKDYEYQEFVINLGDYETHRIKWWNSVEQYYSDM